MVFFNNPYFDICVCLPVSSLPVSIGILLGIKAGKFNLLEYNQGSQPP
jgi:hypothetical protein